jgi:hypothetical protein
MAPLAPGKVRGALVLGLLRRVAIACLRALDSLSSFALVGLVGCATHATELTRGQRAYEQGEDDRALAVLRALEPDVERLRGTERARYWYLRGMTDYRLGYKADARHWLALALAAERTTPGSLSADWVATLTDSLNDLDAAVYQGGIASLFDGGPPSRPAKSVIEAADESSGLLGPGIPSTSDGGR